MTHLPFDSDTPYTSSDISLRLRQAIDRFQPLATVSDKPNARMTEGLYVLASLPESADALRQMRQMVRLSILSEPGPHLDMYENQYDWGQCEARRLGPDPSPCKPGPAADYLMCARVSSLDAPTLHSRSRSLTAQNVPF